MAPDPLDPLKLSRHPSRSHSLRRGFRGRARPPAHHMPRRGGWCYHNAKVSPSVSGSSAGCQSPGSLLHVSLGVWAFCQPLVCSLRRGGRARGLFLLSETVEWETASPAERYVRCRQPLRSHNLRVPVLFRRSGRNNRRRIPRTFYAAVRIHHWCGFAVSRTDRAVTVPFWFLAVVSLALVPLWRVRRTSCVPQSNHRNPLRPSPEYVLPPIRRAPPSPPPQDIALTDSWRRNRWRTIIAGYAEASTHFLLRGILSPRG